MTPLGLVNVSFAMGPWAVRFLGEGAGTLAFTLAASLSVLLNAIVSPPLGAMSDRTGVRKAYLLVFTAMCIAPTLLIGLVGIWARLIFFAIANFGYQAALIYYDAILPDVARPETRGRLSGVGVALGYLGTIVAGLLYGLTENASGDSTALSFVLAGQDHIPGDVGEVQAFQFPDPALAAGQGEQRRYQALLLIAKFDQFLAGRPGHGFYLGCVVFGFVGDWFARADFQLDQP